MKGLLSLAIISLVGIGLVFYAEEEMISDFEKEDNYAEEMVPFSNNITPTYDMYTFAVQWSNTVCLNNIPCDKLARAIPKNEFSIHGLWPNLKSGKSVKCEGVLTSISDNKSEVYENMKRYWPTLSNQNLNKLFWLHEYNKHGFCYSNAKQQTNEMKYFEKTLDLFFQKKINKLIINTFQTEKGTLSVPYQDFISKLEVKVGGKYFSVLCTKDEKDNQYLFEMRFYFNLDFGFIPLTDTKDRISKSQICDKNKPINIIFK